MEVLLVLIEMAQKELMAAFFVVKKAPENTYTLVIVHIELILSFKRKYDFVDVWLVREDIDISELVLQEEEVSDVKWATIDEIRNLMKSSELAKSIDIYFDMFINLIDYPF